MRLCTGQRSSIFRAVTLLAIVALFPLEIITARDVPPDQKEWEADLEGRIRFYQMTEFGVVLAGTGKSLYAVDGQTGQVLWRRKNLQVEENDLAQVPGTDLLILSVEKDERTAFEAIDILSGDVVWKSDKVRGAPMQMAIDIDNRIVAVVVVKDALAHLRRSVKRRPVVHLLDLGTGEQLWKYELERDVEMMPLRWAAKDDEEIGYTLDNYHPPMFLDNRLYLFYDGVVSFESRSRQERIRERFRVNEEGLALTESDPVFDEQFIYISGRGRLRAIDRRSGRVEWEAKDLGLTPEIISDDTSLLVRTGGRFTDIDDGKTVDRGPFGVTALEAGTGKIRWRYKGADKGITNMALLDNGTVAIADRDDLFMLDTLTGKSRLKVRHKINAVSFIIVNDRRLLVLGGREEIAAFDPVTGGEIWRARHTPPSRGILRMITAVALRAASIYFRYGSAFGRTANLLRWSGLARGSLPSLTSLAAVSARERITPRFYSFGSAARLESASRFLARRRRFAALSGEWMYFYTDLKGRGRGLAGVSVNTGRSERMIELDEPDERFVIDEPSRLIMSRGDRLVAISIR